MSEPTAEPVEAPARERAGCRLEAKVAEGPFSEVWRGVRLEDGRPVAVKLARDALGARMLREEADVTRRLRYNTDVVVEVLAFDPGGDEAGEPPALVMPWLGERTFRDVLEAAASDDERVHAARAFVEVVEAVGHVHMLGVVHGDLKPENVLLDEGGRPVLVDFGLARVMRQARLERTLAQSLRSEDALTGGTLAYMAPEVVKGGEPTYQADVYALGVMLHEVLLGRRPDKVTRPEDLRRHLPGEVVDLILGRALAYEPLDRFGRAGHLEVELRLKLAPHLHTGLRRRALGAGRAALAGLAAFFVALRYAFVAALLATYAALAIGTAVTVAHEGVEGLFVLLPALLAVLLHTFVRWEGPETPEEASARTGFFWKKGR